MPKKSSVGSDWTDMKSNSKGGITVITPTAEWDTPDGNVKNWTEMRSRQGRGVSDESTTHQPDPSAGDDVLGK